MEVILDQLHTTAQMILERAQEKKYPNSATLITFSGDLGAGKTTLIKEIAQVLGVEDHLQSPTFVIYKKYEIVSPKRETSYPWKYLIHGDMYRLHSGEEMKVLGWNDLVNNPENIICIEWPEHIQDILPENHIKVTLESLSETTRLIRIT
jgi:tRNA threonylcarbamoyladenosine biosynthesis protein TsaE